MQIIGTPGKAIFDRWTLVHLAFWFVIGANFEAVGIVLWWKWVVILAGAYAWEVFEEWLAANSSMAMVHEGPWNRWVSDPAMGLIGGALGMLLIGN